MGKEGILTFNIECSRNVKLSAEVLLRQIQERATETEESLSTIPESQQSAAELNILLMLN